MTRVPRILGGAATVLATALATMFFHGPALADTSQPDPRAETAATSQESPTTPPAPAPATESLPAAQPSANDLRDPLTGRHLIFRIHVDAAHVEWNQALQNLEVGVMEGEIKPENYKTADQVAIRLGPDADMDGDEVTRFLVPDDPKYQFLGAPGTIWWNAAMQWNQDAGVFAGIGAGTLPDTIQPESVNITLVGVDGPGDVVVFTNNATGISPHLDSRVPANDELRTISELSSGAHGHYNWAFSKPGRYMLKMQASATTTDGQQIQGPVSDLLWLVGPDSAVGLPEGTTPTRTISRTVEQMVSGKAGDTPAGNEPGQTTEEPGQTPGQPGSEPGAGTGTDGNNSTEITNDVTLPWKFSCAAPDHYDLMAQARDDQVKVVLLQGPEGNTVAHQSRSVVIPVPDVASTVISGTNLEALGALGSRVWALPEAQDPKLVWPGFNTGDVDYSLLDDSGVQLELGYLSGPTRGSEAGRMMMWDYPIQTGLRVLIDSTDKTKSIRFTERAHRHTATSFTMPGLYEADFSYSLAYNQETMERLKLSVPQNYSSFTVFYAVGDEAVEQACPGYLKQYGLIAANGGGNISDGADTAPTNPTEPANPTNPSAGSGATSGESADDHRENGEKLDENNGSGKENGSGSGSGTTGQNAGVVGINGKTPPASTKSQLAAGSGNSAGNSKDVTKNSTKDAVAQASALRQFVTLTAPATQGLLAQTGSGGLFAGNNQAAQSGATAKGSAGLVAQEGSQSGIQAQSGLQAQSGMSLRQGAQGQSGAHSDDPSGRILAGDQTLETATGQGFNVVWVVVVLWAVATVALAVVLVQRYRAKRELR